MDFVAAAVAAAAALSPPPATAGDARLDTQAVVEQLTALSRHLTRLEGLWLSDNVVGPGALLPLQELLAVGGAPLITLRPAASDWFWGTNFPIGSSLEGDNPLIWWKFTPWGIL
jgi:hypothetical protein